MKLEILHDKSEILNYLKPNAAFQVYCIGDLDDFFWPKTIWYCLKAEGKIKSLALLYSGMDIPTLLLFHDGDPYYSVQLIRLAKKHLPEKFNAHLSAGLLSEFGEQNVIKYYGLGYKMILKGNVPVQDENNIKRLSVADQSLINELLAEAYPENWFDSRMLETGKYFGYFSNDLLVGVAGIHVYSPEFKVAALGNISTHPDFRGRQIAFKLTSALCHDLQREDVMTGLNVNSENESAIRCYRRIGFEVIGTYDECFLRNHSY
jgi:predicted GNAT family acetyltransferase